MEDTHRLKVKGWKNILNANENKEKADIAMLISGKINFKTKAIVRDKAGHCIMIKGAIQQEDITLVDFVHPKWKPLNMYRKS